MKRFFAVFFLGFFLSLNCFGWGYVGHSTIAKVAENHLTSKAKAAISEYLGGMPLPAIASDPDIYRGTWTLDLGYHPTNPTVARGSWVKGFDHSTPTNIAPYAHSMAVDMDFNPIRSDNFDGEYFENAVIYIDRLTEKLKSGYATMDPKERYIAIIMLVHLVGDMHCPMHVRYFPDDTTIGNFKVFIGKNEVVLHKYWDDGVFTCFPWGFGDLADMVDNASKKEMKEISKGDVYDWARSSAIASWPLHKVKEGDTLPFTYGTDMRAFCFTQLRDAGYRLASLLNDIFK